jgi:Domain of unknown function (DUF4390)
MMAFITHCWKKARFDGTVRLCCVLLSCAFASTAQAQGLSPEVATLQVERNADNLLLSASVNFELPSTVEDALLKGVPVIFVSEVDVSRERWYWFDKKVITSERHMRLMFQPLTRRWRLTVGAGHITNNGLGVALNQNYDALGDALAAIRRVSGWRIADLTDLVPGAVYRVDYRFRLDVSQLPRPLQIGAIGQSDWILSTAASQRLVVENLK